MAYTGTIVTEADMALMAGEMVDATGNTADNHTLLAAQAEAYLSAVLRKDIVTNWATLTAVTKAMLTEWAARYAGMTLIAYNMVAYSSRQEAEDMINIHWARMQMIEQNLRFSTVNDFIGE